MRGAFVGPAFRNLEEPFAPVSRSNRLRKASPPIGRPIRSAFLSRSSARSSSPALLHQVHCHRNYCHRNLGYPSYGGLQSARQYSGLMHDCGRNGCIALRFARAHDIYPLWGRISEYFYRHPTECVRPQWYAKRRYHSLGIAELSSPIGRLACSVQWHRQGSLRKDRDRT